MCCPPFKIFLRVERPMQSELSNNRIAKDRATPQDGISHINSWIRARYETLVWG